MRCFHSLFQVSEHALEAQSALQILQTLYEPEKPVPILDKEKESSSGIQINGTVSEQKTEEQKTESNHVNGSGSFGVDVSTQSGDKPPPV